MGTLNENKLSKKLIVFLISAYCAFFVYAFYFNTFGTNAPVMMAFYGITSAQQGFILTTQSVGALAVSIFLALHGERFNKIYLAGLGLLISGFAGIAIGFAPSYVALLFLVVAAGGGYTIFDIMTNGMISDIYPKQKNTFLPLLHAFFGVGAMVTPIFVATLVNPDVPQSFTRPFMLIGISTIAVVVILLIAGKRIIPETPYSDMASIKKRVSDNPAEVFKDKKAWIILAAGFMYFTFQIGLVSWLPSFCLESGMDFGTAGGMLTAFFAGSLIMRFCGPLFLKKITAQKAYILFSLLSALSVGTALFMTTPMVMTPLLVFGGFMQGSCVAFLILMAIEAFPHRAASASSLILIAVNTGAMTAPLWIGFVAEFTGYRLPLLLVCSSLALSVVLVILLRRMGSKPSDG